MLVFPVVFWLSVQYTKTNQKFFLSFVFTIFKEHYLMFGKRRFELILDSAIAIEMNYVVLINLKVTYI